MISVFDRVENIVDKGQYAGIQHIFIFPHYFQDPLPLFMFVKTWDFVVKD